jgi:hypothetical protein
MIERRRLPSKRLFRSGKRKYLASQRSVDKWFLGTIGCPIDFVTHPAHDDTDIEVGRAKMLQQR